MDQTTCERLRVRSAAAMLAMGKTLSSLCASDMSIYLSGPLGTGKTTLARGILAGLGYGGRVKSPSYALVESYMVSGLSVHHIDLYRLSGRQDMESLGIRDYMDGRSLCLLEWPERAGTLLPLPTIHIRLTMTGEKERTLRLSLGEAVKHRAKEELLDEMRFVAAGREIQS